MNFTNLYSDDSRISWEEITENWYSNLVEGKWTQELSGGK
jgi:hypothetical protein